MQRQTRAAAYILAIVLGLGAAGCGSSGTPSTPSPSTITLSGTVKDSTTGAGLVGAAVVILDGPNANRSTTTDAAGAYTLAGLTSGGFTARASLTGYLAQSQPVTLTGSTIAAFALVKVPAANLISLAGSTATPSLGPDGLSLQYSFDAHNIGAGCAASVSGTFQLQDNNHLTLTSLPWAWPTGTILQPGQSFGTTACCTSAQTALSSKFYLVTFAFTSVACS